jgi:hypothetical protein
MCEITIQKIRTRLSTLWHARFPPRGAEHPQPSLEERIRRRAYFLWEAEGRPEGSQASHWQMAQIIELSAEIGSKTPTTIEILEFQSELAEVQLLLDFISGRPDLGFHGAASSSAGSAKTAARASDSITIEELERISTIRFPPDKSATANAQDAAFLLTFRDKLNQCVWPASGLTIAFTLLTWASFRAIAFDRGRDWARWTLARQAYPRLNGSIYKFWFTSGLLLIAAISCVFLSLWSADEVAWGKATLARFQVLEQQRIVLTANLEQFENLAPVTQSGSNQMVQNTAAPAAGDPGMAVPAPIDPVELDCFRLPPATAGSGNAGQMALTCSEISLIDLEMERTALQIKTWWIMWNRSPVLQALHAPLDALAVAEHIEVGIRNPQGVPIPGGGSTGARPFTFPMVSGSAANSDYLSEPALAATLSASSVLDAKLTDLSNIWLPMLYGFIGAVVAALRSVYYKVSNSMLAPWDTRLIWTRVMLGTTAGAIIGLFFSPSGTTLEGSTGLGTLSLSAVAFLAGYAVEGLFTMLDQIIHIIFKTNPSSVPAGKQ